MKGLFWVLISLIIGCNHIDKDKYIFIGDSLIRNWDTDKYFPYLKVENLGVDGYKIEDCKNLIIEDRNATVILLVGTNNLVSPMNKEYIDKFTNDYIELINSFICKRVICISLLPKDKFEYNIIETTNDSIKRQLKNLSNIIFLEVAEDFLYKGGMNPEYTVDGIHLNTKGYDLLSSKLSKIL